MRLQPINIGNLNVRVPIIQGGMGVGISRYRLAASVAAAGGVGIISTAQIGYDEADYEIKPLEANLRSIGKHVEKARQIANGGVIGVNIMVATRYYEKYVKASIDAGVDIILSGAGLPVDLPELVQNTQVKIAPIVSSVKAALVICRLWDRKYKRYPDMVVIEGPQAGGHLGFSPEMLKTITEQDFDTEIKKIIQTVQSFGSKYKVKIPIIAAGGIFHKSDVKRYMDLGADGIQVATRFVTTKECDASDEYKQQYLNAKKEDIILVKSPVGMPGRAIRNRFMLSCENENHRPTKCYACIKNCKTPNIPYCISKALVNAVKGNIDEGLIFCGAKAYLCNKIETVKEIVEELSEYD